MDLLARWGLVFDFKIFDLVVVGEHPFEQLVEFLPAHAEGLENRPHQQLLLGLPEKLLDRGVHVEQVARAVAEEDEIGQLIEHVAIMGQRTVKRVLEVVEFPFLLMGVDRLENPIIEQLRYIRAAGDDFPVDRYIWDQGVEGFSLVGVNDEDHRHWRGVARQGMQDPLVIGKQGVEREDHQVVDRLIEGLPGLLDVLNGDGLT